MTSHMQELLPAYAAGSLAGADRDRVRAHLTGCPRCQAELAAWRPIAAAASPADHRAPEPDQLVRAVLTRSALAEEPALEAPASGPRKHLRYLAALVLAEARLIRLAVPIASALVMALGVVLELVGSATGGADSGSGDGIAAGDLLALTAPIVAAAGVAGTYRSRRDPAAELVAATPTSGRLLLLARLSLVFGYDLALALAASALLALTTADAAGVATSLHGLISGWLGPMALLSSLSLFLAVRFGPDVALGTAVGVWALRMLAGGEFARDLWPTGLILEVWSTSAAVLMVSGALGIVAVVTAGRSGPLAGEPNRGWRATHPM